MRPDRINISSDNTAVIIDYKTGSQNIWHADQLTEYANALQQMDIEVLQKILIYSNEGEIVINKV